MPPKETTSQPTRQQSDIAHRQAVVAGHLCLDIIPGFDTVPPGQFLNLLQPGKMITAGPATLATGGAVSNTGLALFRLGIPTQLIGKLGRDPFAEAVCRVISGFDPDLTTKMVEDPQSNTSYTICISPPGIDRMFLHCPGANETFSPEEIDNSLFSQADLFHFGYPPVMREFYKNDGAGLAEMLRRAKQMGVTTSIDLTFPDPLSEGARMDWKAIFRAILPYTDIFAPSVEELLFLVDRPTFEHLSACEDFLSQVTPTLLSDLSGEMLTMGAKIVLLKLGDCGAYLRTAGKTELGNLGRAMPGNLQPWENRELLAPCFLVKVVGTVGSGDATIAGLLAGLLREMPAEDALTAAVAVGACNVEAADALSGLPTWSGLLARLQTTWERLPTRIPVDGWTWQPVPGLWVSPRDQKLFNLR